MLRKLGVFGVSYWTAAAVQFIGTLAVFYVVGGGGARGALYSLSGAMCLELVIVALNAYGVTRTGPFRWVLWIAAMILICISGAVQIADMSMTQYSDELKSQMGGMLGFMMIIVPATPSLAMGITTTIKFVGTLGDTTLILKAKDDQIKRYQEIIEQDQVEIEGHVAAISKLKIQLEECKARPIVQQAFVVSKQNKSHNVVSEQVKALAQSGMAPAEVARKILEGQELSPDYKRLMVNYTKMAGRAKK